MPGRLVRVVATAGAAILGLFAGCVYGYNNYANGRSSEYPFLAESTPLPHHVPQFSGGLSLRFAMVHDVLHERFPKHGRGYYQERNRLTRQRLAALAPDDPAVFPLSDDLAAGLERIGKPDEAVAVMREKLARQQARGLTGESLYTSYANLGTFLIHANFPKAVTGDPTAWKQVREGLDLVKKSVEVNPQAHFGRERWQVVLAEFMLAAMDNPKLLRTFDCLGNRLDFGVDEILQRKRNSAGRTYGRAATPEFVPTFFPPNALLDDAAQWNELKPIRDYITHVGAENGWEELPLSAHRTAPFDEPLLGIIGMWRQGGGASPHFALAIGEVMLRVGQRHIAWSAFERASRLAGRYWPDPDLQQFLRQHCRDRQTQIEKALSVPPSTDVRLDIPRTGPAISPEEIADLRPRFDAELAYGEGYQRAYQEYEEKQIAAGVSITDEHFFDAFHTGREPIASPVGPEEQYVWVPPAKTYKYMREQAWAWGAFGAGLAAILVAALLCLTTRRDPKRETNPG